MVKDMAIGRGEESRLLMQSSKFCYLSFDLASRVYFPHPFQLKVSVPQNIQTNISSSLFSFELLDIASVFHFYICRHQRMNYGKCDFGHEYPERL